MLSRKDRENLHLATSTDVHHWNDVAELYRPQHPWELLQIGNCGSPIETEAGWLVLTHGVGPMRRYAIGALLLDLARSAARDRPSVRNRCSSPTRTSAKGYVPNVVYTCGAIVHGDQLIVPYGFSDAGIAVAHLRARRSARGVACERFAQIAGPLIPVGLAPVADVAQRPPHVLYDLHAFERCLQRVGSGMDGRHRGIASSLGGHSRFFGRAPRRLRDGAQDLLLVADRLERRTMPVSDVARFLCEGPEPLCRASGRFVGYAPLFGQSAVGLRSSARVLTLLARTFRLLAVLLRDGVVRHCGLIESISRAGRC